jgi:hypothetical protein
MTYSFVLATGADLFWHDPTHGASAPPGAGAPTIGSWAILAVVLLVCFAVAKARSH